MPVPVFWHHDAAEVGVAAEVNAEEVEDLTLIKVGGGPGRGDCVDAFDVADEEDDKTQPLLQRNREGLVDDLEARWGGVRVDGGDVFEEFVARLLYAFTGRDDAFARAGNRKRTRINSSRHI